MKRKAPSGAFISYAHVDAKNQTDRIAFALRLHTNVFTDAEIQPGPFPPELYKEIEAHKFFLAVMSEFSVKENGWCREELRYARKKSRKIIPIMISNIKDTELEQEIETNTYADFRNDFEQGFRRLTKLMFNYPVSSWEHFGDTNIDFSGMDTELKAGHIPGLIAKEIAEWSLADVLWPYVMQRLLQLHLAVPQARTVLGILDSLVFIREQLGQTPEQSALFIIPDVEKLINDHIRRFANVRDTDNQVAGPNAASTIENVRQLIMQQEAARLRTQQVANLLATFPMNATEKLKELILLHARRSRYLY